MSDRGKLSGFCWHEEYHTISRKKAKAADCIYLTESRICRNHKCVQYGEKCFVATYCPYRIKEKQPEKTQEEVAVANHQEHAIVPKHITKINCTIPKGAELYSQAYGKGAYLSFENKFRIISVSFGTEVKTFRYPEAFIEGHICAAGPIYQRVQQDIQNAVRE